MISPSSLRTRLLLGAGISLLALWLALAPWLLAGVAREVNRSLDERLISTAQMVGSLLTPQDAAVDFDALARRAGLEQDNDRLACKVRTLQGRVITMSANAPGEGWQHTTTGFREIRVDDQQWRTYTAEHNGMLVSIADRVASRDELMTAILIATAVPFVVALVGTLLLIAAITRREFKPLTALAGRLAAREPSCAEPLSWNGRPSEVAPFISRINQLLARLNDVLERERRFTGDAAHELRTPLTGIRTQLQLMRLTDGEPRERALQQAERGVEKMAATLEQLLLLARLDNAADFYTRSDESAHDITVEVLGELRDQAGEKSLQLHYQCQCELIPAAPAELVSVALRNLISNACKVSPKQGVVAIYCLSEQGDCVWRIEDDGPGMAASELRALPRRFLRYRPGGTGLGLAIVDSICSRFGGRLLLENRAQGGLSARLRFPARPAAD